MSAGQQWLEALLKYCGFNTTVSAERPAACETDLKGFGGNWLTINADQLLPQQLAMLLDDKKAVLDAIQYLINATLNLGHSADQQAVYTVEVANYRMKRYLELAELAGQVAARARQTGAEVELPPISAAERRLVHTLLTEEMGLETYSRGQEPDRRLVVRPIEQ